MLTTLIYLSNANFLSFSVKLKSLPLPSAIPIQHSENFKCIYIHI